MLSQSVINVVYVIAAVLFILGLKGMAHPRTARRGNITSSVGMLIAVVVTLFSGGLEFSTIAIGIAIGAAIGAIFAIRIAMTSMPEMVAIFNGFGGAASVMVAAAELDKAIVLHGGTADMQMSIATVLAGLIGSVTFFGSYIAFGKLAEFLAVKWKLYLWQNLVKAGFALAMIALGVYTAWKFNFHWLGYVTIGFYVLTALVMYSKKAVFPGMQALKIVSAVIALVFGILLIVQLSSGNPVIPGVSMLMLYWSLIAAAALLGVVLTFSIGGADMPVVIALLNSYSGIAAAMTGFVISNTVLIISGSLVGASGIILTQIMCKAMNRSLANVLFGAMGSSESEMDADEIYKNVKATSADEIAMMLETAQRVLIVPGYGMAVSQAQHAVRDLGNLLESKFAAEVFYGVHAVAGRMPGHMNVLLAEANVPYDKLWDENEANSNMDSIDVAIVIGANDVVNPVARTDPQSPIAGMPIIDVDKAKTVVVIKRSLSPGFAGIPNPLFALDNSLMFFNDGKKAFTQIIEAVKES
jgi:NAD(P) transhydrogenase subunit beta